MSAIKELRKEQNLTQQQAAELIGISIRSFKSYENDESKAGTLKYKYILDKLKVNKSKKDSAGGHADVTFSDTRTRGKGKKTRNAEIAFVNEFGKAGQAARPFVKNAVENFADEITAPGEKVIGDWLENEWEK